MPFLAILYFLSFLDRVNVSFAALTMNADIGLSAAAFGFGAGIFFLGYILFAVPSNIMLKRYGAARWIGLIAILWGLTSATTALVRTPAEFFIVRLLLGAAEAGFFPGVILYLTVWFPSDIRGRIVAGFFVAAPLSSVVGAPLSSWLLTHHPPGLSGWRMMFAAESVPAVALGLIARFSLPDSPDRASWLTPRQRASFERPQLAPERVFIRGILRKKSYICSSCIYFMLVLCLYGFGFFVPAIFMMQTNLSTEQTGWAVAAPYLASTIAMITWARHSDFRAERLWHFILAAITGAAGFLLAAFISSVEGLLVAFALASAGIFAACPIFWAIVVEPIPANEAPAAIALINSVGNLAGCVGPVMMGGVIQITGSSFVGMIMLASCLSMAAVLTWLLGQQPPKSTRFWIRLCTPAMRP